MKPKKAFVDQVLAHEHQSFGFLLGYDAGHEQMLLEDEVVFRVIVMFAAILVDSISNEGVLLSERRTRRGSSGRPRRRTWGGHGGLRGRVLSMWIDVNDHVLGPSDWPHE